MLCCCVCVRVCVCMQNWKVEMEVDVCLKWACVCTFFLFLLQTQQYTASAHDWLQGEVRGHWIQLKRILINQSPWLNMITHGVRPVFATHSPFLHWHHVSQHAFHCAAEVVRIENTPFPLILHVLIDSQLRHTCGNRRAFKNLLTFVSSAVRLHLAVSVWQLLQTRTRFTLFAVKK